MNKEMLFRRELLFLICFFTFNLSIFYLSACSKALGEEKYINPSSVYSLSPERLEELSAKGEAGDADAAHRVWKYYGIYGPCKCEEDQKNAFYWETKAAENGDVNAQYGLGLEYSSNPRKKDKEKAIYWFRKAAENGDSDAKRHLEELMKEK